MSCTPICLQTYCRWTCFVFKIKPSQSRRQVFGSPFSVHEVIRSQIRSLKIVEENISNQILLTPPTGNAPGKSQGWSASKDSLHESMIAQRFDIGNLPNLDVCLTEADQYVNTPLPLRVSKGVQAIQVVNDFQVRVRGKGNEVSPS